MNHNENYSLINLFSFYLDEAIAYLECVVENPKTWSNVWLEQCMFNVYMAKDVLIYVEE